MAEDYTPIVEELLKRIDKLEQNVAELNQHQHYVGDPTGRRSSLPCTRPIGFGGRR